MSKRKMVRLIVDSKYVGGNAPSIWVSSYLSCNKMLLLLLFLVHPVVNTLTLFKFTENFIWQYTLTLWADVSWSNRWNTVCPAAVSPSSPLDNIRAVVIVWRLRENIIRTALCARLCDTMFTVSSTLMWAVLTGQTECVCHIGTLTPCVESVLELYYCNMVELFW